MIGLIQYGVSNYIVDVCRINGNIRFVGVFIKVDFFIVNFNVFKGFRKLKIWKGIDFMLVGYYGDSQE